MVIIPRDHTPINSQLPSLAFPPILAKGGGGGGGVFDGIGWILALQPSGRNSILGSKFTKGVYEVLYHNHSS